MDIPISRPAPGDGESQGETDSVGMIYFFVEGDGDTTIRPALPITLLKRPLRPQQPPKPSEPASSEGDA